MVTSSGIYGYIIRYLWLHHQL